MSGSTYQRCLESSRSAMATLRSLLVIFLYLWLVLCRATTAERRGWQHMRLKYSTCMSG